MKIHNCEQRSEEWYQARLGKVTASHFSAVMAKGRGGAASKTRLDYMKTLANERLTGKRDPDGTYTNRAMENGTLREPDARDWYEWITGKDVVEVGFVELNDEVGCSPDGLVDIDGLLEIKCPAYKTHMDYRRDGVFPSEYRPQVQGQMWVCGRQWCDFVSYYPDLFVNGEDLRLWILRVKRDDSYIEQLAAATAVFLTELKELEGKPL